MKSYINTICSIITAILAFVYSSCNNDLKNKELEFNINVITPISSDSSTKLCIRNMLQGFPDISYAFLEDSLKKFIISNYSVDEGFNKLIGLSHSKYVNEIINRKYSDLHFLDSIYIHCCQSSGNNLDWKEFIIKYNSIINEAIELTILTSKNSDSILFVLNNQYIRKLKRSERKESFLKYCHDLMQYQTNVLKSIDWSKISSENSLYVILWGVEMRIVLIKYEAVLINSHYHLSKRFILDPAIIAEYPFREM